MDKKIEKKSNKHVTVKLDDGTSVSGILKGKTWVQNGPSESIIIEKDNGGTDQIPINIIDDID